MLVSEDYPWGKLLREYATYCAVGCINVIAFFILYYWLYEMRLSEGYPAATAWAVSYFLSSWQAHYLHRWLTFESPTGYAKSLFVMMAIYAILLVISTASTAYFADILGVNHLYSWAANTASSLCGRSHSPSPTGASHGKNASRSSETGVGLEVASFLAGP